LFVAAATIIWQIAPFAPTVACAQAPQAPADESTVSPPSPQCPPPTTLAALPGTSGSARFSNPFTGRLESATLAVCVLPVAPQGDCPNGSVALSLPGAKGAICILPAVCPTGYALTGTWCCLAHQATSQGFCCPPGHSPQPNGLCGPAP